VVDPDRCSDLVREFKRWQKRKNIKEAIIEEGEKRNDHALDCVRYIINTDAEDALLRLERNDQLSTNALKPKKNPVAKNMREAWENKMTDEDGYLDDDYEDESFDDSDDLVDWELYN